MKPILITIALFAFFSKTKAQQSTSPKPADQKNEIMRQEAKDTPFVHKADIDTRIFVVVEHEPEFNGGDKAFAKYLQMSIHYPAKSFENHIQGKVFITLIVEKDGSLSDLKVVRGVSDDIDAERPLG